MLKRKSIILSAVLIVVLFFNACKVQQTKSDTQEPVKVAAIMTLSGKEKELGESAKNSLELLSKDFKKKNIEIIYIDDENDAEKAEDTLKKAITKEKIKVIILCSQNEVSEAITKMASENKIIVINATDTTSTLDSVGKGYVYSLCYNNEFEGGALAQFSYEKLKFRNIAIIYNEKNASSKEVNNSFKDKFEKLGGKIVISLPYSSPTKDYWTKLNLLNTYKYDALILPNPYTEVNDIVSEAKKIGINSVLLGNQQWEDKTLKTNPYFQNSYFSCQFVNDDSFPGSIEFKKEYESTFKMKPDSRAALTYDAGKVIQLVFEKVVDTENPEKLKESIEKVNFIGASGNISFGQNKRVKKGLNVLEIKNNNIEIVDRVMP